VAQTGVGELLARCLASELLALADVGYRTERLPIVDAGVDRDDRNACFDRCLDAVFERWRVRHGDDQAVGVCGHGVVDQGALSSRIGVVAVVHVDAGVLGRLLGAGLDDVPERVAGACMGDDIDPEPAARSGAGAAAAVTAAAPAVIVAASGESQCSHRQTHN